MNKEKLDEMINDLVYSVKWHTKQLEEKAIQLKALQQMKEGEK
jgi:membrane-associated HD superfamily phosphohydrolase